MDRGTKIMPDATVEAYERKVGAAFSQLSHLPWGSPQWKGQLLLQLAMENLDLVPYGNVESVHRPGHWRTTTFNGDTFFIVERDYYTNLSDCGNALKRPQRPS